MEHAQLEERHGDGGGGGGGIVRRVVIQKREEKQGRTRGKEEGNGKEREK